MQNLYILLAIIGIFLFGWKWLDYRKAVVSSAGYPKRKAAYYLLTAFLVIVIGFNTILGDLMYDYLGKTKPPNYELYNLLAFTVLCIAYAVIFWRGEKSLDEEQPKETIKQKIEGNISGVGNIGKVEGGLHIHQAADKKKDKSLENGGPIFLTTTQRAPLSSDKVIGREKELKNITESLEKEDAVLLLNGMGGIGKTTLAGHYLQNQKHIYKHIAWINYTGSIADDIVREINRYSFLGIEFIPNTQEMLQQLLATIGRLPTPNLLIIDNINTEEQATDIATFANQFPAGWKVLLTFRVNIGTFTPHAIGVLNETDAIDLFHRFYTPKTNETKADLIALLTQVGRHTLAIEMLAKTLTAQGNWDIKKILEKLKGKGITQLSTDTTVATAHSHKTLKSLHQYISTIFDISIDSLDDEEKHILLQMAVLPPFAHPFDQLCRFLGKNTDEEQDAFSPKLNRLVDKGFLELQSIDEASAYYMHPVLQDVIREKGQPDYEKCADFVDYFIDLFNYHAKENPVTFFPFLPYGTSILKNITEEHEYIAKLANNLSLIYIFQGNLENALAFQNKANEIWEKVLDKDHPDLATSYNNISEIYRHQGDLENALVFQNKAIQIREKTLDESHPNLAISYNNISLIYSDQGDLKNALIFQNKAIKIREKVLDKSHPKLAISYLNLATIYYKLNKMNEAKKWIDQSIAILKKNFPNGHPDLDNALEWQEGIEAVRKG